MTRKSLGVTIHDAKLRNGVEFYDLVNERDFHTILEGAHVVISSFTFNHSHKLACFSTLFFMHFITFACPQ